MVISVTVIGKNLKGKSIKTAGAKIDDDIIVTKALGLEGTYILINDYEERIQKILSKEEIDLTNPVATYENEPQGFWNKFAYYVLETSKTSYIKRVIGLPGDYVEIKDGAVYINGEKLQEDYLQSGVVTDMHQDATHEGNFTGFTVPENCVFCLGDNRTGSRDCRSFGCIPLEKIEGKVLFRFWPLNKFGKV